MSEDFGFCKGIVKSADIEEVRKEIEGGEGYEKTKKLIETEEPLFMAEVYNIASEETQRVEDILARWSYHCFTEQ